MIYIVLSSITYANKAKNLLNSNNIKCEIVQTPNTIAGRKCSYSITVDKKSSQLAIDIVAINDCHLLGVYECRDGGMYEHMMD